MKKNFFYWMTILMVAIVSVNLVSCGDDDDDAPTPTTTPSIIGTWRFDYDGGYELVTFKSNGKGTVREYHLWEGGLDDDEETFKYVFNPSTMILTITYEDGDVSTCIVTTLTSETMVIDGDTYVKQ